MSKTTHYLDDDYLVLEISECAEGVLAEVVYGIGARRTNVLSPRKGPSVAVVLAGIARDLMICATRIIAAATAGIRGPFDDDPLPRGSKIRRRVTRALDGDRFTRIDGGLCRPLDDRKLLLEVIEYEDGLCRAQVLRCDEGTRTMVMLQRQGSVELVLATIARDFATYAARVLAAIPTIGPMRDWRGNTSAPFLREDEDEGEGEA